MLCHMHHPIAEPYQGGTESHTAMLVDGLVARGHDVTIFAKEGSRTRARLRSQVPADFRFGAASDLVRHQQRGFLAEAAQHSIDTIVAGDWDVVINASLSSLPYRSLRGVPTLTVLHTPPTLADVNAILDDPGWRPPDDHDYVTVSATNARAWTDRLPGVRVIPNGLDLDVWRSRVRRRPGVALWAARITPEKGLHVAIDAAIDAGLDLEIAGPIASTAYYDAEIAPRLGGRIRHVGHLDHRALPDFLASGSVFVASPRWSEPFGLSVVEAMASGTPVAALPNGAMPDLVVPEAGVLALTDDAPALARAIREASRLPSGPVRAAATRYSAEAMLDRYEELLRHLARHASVV